MKIAAIPTTIVALLLLTAYAAEQAPAKKPIDLFDGRSLAGWSHFLLDDSVAKGDVWSVQDGVLVCKGEPLGYLYTDASFQDFKLVVEWRWAPDSEPGNSGVLLRIAGKAISFLPKCVEAQLQGGSAGDIWAFYGANVAGDPDRMREIEDHKDLGNFKGVGKIVGAENPPGEWNTYEITLQGGDLELRINDKLVNEATNLDVLSGPIGLQSEGAEIHFRKVQISTL